jgi:hypothetical protein
MHYHYYFIDTRQMIDPEGKISRHTSFDDIKVQGGGIFEVESDAGGLSVSCNQLIINSGGKFQVTKLDLTANLVRIEQSGILEANYKAEVMIITRHRTFFITKIICGVALRL